MNPNFPRLVPEVKERGLTAIIISSVTTSVAGSSSTTPSVIIMMVAVSSRTVLFANWMGGRGRCPRIRWQYRCVLLWCRAAMRWHCRRRRCVIIASLWRLLYRCATVLTNRWRPGTLMWLVVVTGPTVAAVSVIPDGFPTRWRIAILTSSRWYVFSFTIVFGATSIASCKNISQFLATNLI